MNHTHCKWGRYILKQILFSSYGLHWDVVKDKTQHVHWAWSHLGDAAKEKDHKYERMLLPKKTNMKLLNIYPDQSQDQGFSLSL